MGRELDGVVKEFKLSKEKDYKPIIIDSFELRNLKGDDFANTYNTLKELKVKTVEEEKYLSCDMIELKYREVNKNKTSIENYLFNLKIKDLSLFLLRNKNKGKNICMSNYYNQILIIDRFEEIDVEVMDYDEADDETECNGKDFMRAVDKLKDEYGFSLYPSLIIADSLYDYGVNDYSKNEVIRVKESDSKKLSIVLEHVKELYKNKWNNDSYKEYFEFILIELKKGHKFVYSV